MKVKKVARNIVEALHLNAKGRLGSAAFRRAVAERKVVRIRRLTQEESEARAILRRGNAILRSKGIFKR